MVTTALILAAAAGLPARPLADVVIKSDNVEITESCRIVIPPGATIADADGNGVIRIKGSNITVEFADGAELWGGPRPAGPENGAWDAYAGTGVRVEGKGVTLKNLRVHGYKVGVWAQGADGLTVDAADLSDNFRQHLRSTPAAENGADWLYPHHNDKDEWVTQWGGALYIREAKGVTVRNVKIRRGQNGILLNRVTDSKIYDNDCSFLTGWGVGMFRASGNTVTRNALDFCVRGHSEGIYNRGQDSAGLLMFEQCSNNIIAENSITHGGDGIFGFAGLEALEGEGAPPGYDHTRKGCNDNIFMGNDLSYAPAHGLEMTFSFGNKVINNRFVENAICGVWGGYSQDFLIAGNEFSGNGGMAYGMERGAINIEHAANDVVVGNRFANNKVAVYLWWNPSGLIEKPWGKANYKGLLGNIIAGNTIVIDGNHPFKTMSAGQKLIGLQLKQGAPDKFKNTVYAGNTVQIDPAVGVETDVAPGIPLDTGAAMPAWTAPKVEVLGNARPVGARANLRGRSQIIMGEWGPWDHQTPLLRPSSMAGAEHIYELFGAEPAKVTLDPAASDAVTAAASPAGALQRITFTGKAGVARYSAKIEAAGWTKTVSGVLVGATWDLKAFTWTDATDPRAPEKLAAWRALADSEGAISAKAPGIKFDYGGGGPRDQAWGKPFGDKAPGPDRFGVIAKTKIAFPKGSWKFSTLSDDGVRVTANGKTVLENWTWHAPTRNDGVLTLAEAAEVEITVEHFEIDGYSTLSLEISPQ